MLTKAKYKNKIISGPINKMPLPQSDRSRTAIIVLVVLLIAVSIALIIWAVVSNNNDDSSNGGSGGLSAAALAAEAANAPLATVEDNASNTDPRSVEASSVDSDSGRKAPAAILAEMKKNSPLAKDGGNGKKIVSEGRKISPASLTLNNKHVRNLTDSSSRISLSHSNPASFSSDFSSKGERSSSSGSSELSSVVSDKKHHRRSHSDDL